MTELEQKLHAALVAADKAFTDGYPVKAHSIVKGALALREAVVAAPSAHCDGPGPLHLKGSRGLCRDCERHRIHEAAMNH